MYLQLGDAYLEDVIFFKMTKNKNKNVLQQWQF